MKGIREFLVILAAVAAVGTGCRQRAADEIDFGRVENAVYQNTYFGLSVSLPPAWNIQDEAARKQLMELGGKMMAGKDRNLKAAVKASDLTTVNLFSAFEHPLGAPVMFNPSIMCVAERIRQAPGVKRGRDYLFHARRAMEASAMKFKFSGEVESETLGGRVFDVLPMEMDISGMTVRQRYYATIDQGYALCFIISFVTPEQETVARDILKTVKFK